MTSATSNVGLAIQPKQFRRFIGTAGPSAYGHCQRFWRSGALPAKTPVSDAMVSRNNMRFMDAVAPCAGDAQIVVFISF
jgi:hypothetical protein